MKKILFILFTLILLHSCNKNIDKDDLSINSSNDSLRFYFNKFNTTKIDEFEKEILANRALKLLSVNENTNRNRDSLFKLVYYYFSKNNEKYFRKSSDLLYSNSLSANDSINLINYYRYKGGFFKNNNIYDSAFYNYIKAEKLCIKFNENLSYANILLNKGIVLYSINDFLSAEVSLYQALNIFKASNEKYKYYVTLNQLGLVSNELRNFNKAIEYHNEALKIVKENKLIDNSHPEAVCYNNLGYVYIKQGEYKKAIETFNTALNDKNIKMDDPDLYAYLIDNKAFSLLQENNYKDLPNLFYEALELRKNINNINATVGSYIHLSEYYFRIKDTMKAIHFSNSAIALSRKEKSPMSIVSSLKQASLVDIKNSSNYSNDYIKITDSLQEAANKSKDRFARIMFETDELRQQNTQLSEQNRDILNYFAIAIVFGGFLFFARFQRLRARELALKQTQQQANEEIYRLIISHQNQLEEGRDLEKKRISKELHDGVLGRLFGLRLNLDGLNNFDDEETKQMRLDYLNELKVIEQDLREISHELSRENLVLINNFVAIINNLLEEQSKINKAKINTLISDKIDWENVSNTIKINLYRILQESLQNINKHAEAEKINIIFNKDSKGNLIFSVEDDGKGYNTNGKKTKGIGMNNIVERVHQCQGKIDIKSQIGKGTKIIITFPLENETINI